MIIVLINIIDKRMNEHENPDFSDVRNCKTFNNNCGIKYHQSYKPQFERGLTSRT